MIALGEPLSVKRAMWDSLRESIGWFLQQSRTAPLRTMREFAEQEIVIPDGPFEGMMFNVDRQPFAGLWFDCVDSGDWSRFCITGPSQSGKTLMGSVIPVLYHLFEVEETVVFGLPSLEMALDKWREDLLPVIERTRYRELLPKEGLGSRGGSSQARPVKFKNGATLKFMTAGGSDKSRAGFTSRVLVVTEVDGMDESGGTSREADKITQMEARTRAFGDRRRIYLECTVTIPDGRTWREYQNGTRSEILLPCPHCGKHVKLEREHFAGWQTAETKADAANSAFYCYECGAEWSRDDRRQANTSCLLVHRNQEVVGGKIVGDAIETDTLGFRWSAVNNLLTPESILGSDEWMAARDPDEANAERGMKQFVWCEPVDPDEEEETPLDLQGVAARLSSTGRGVVPAGSDIVTIAADVGSKKIHWVATAWAADATATVIDYGELFVYSNRMGIEPAIVRALQYLRDEIAERGFQDEDTGKADRLPDQVWIDAGYKAPAIYRFIRECSKANKWKKVYRPVFGRGAGRQYREKYLQPGKRSKTNVHVAANYYFSRQTAHQVTAVILNSDAWKSFVHKRLETPVSEPGALTMFVPSDRDHTPFMKHLLAERETREFVPKIGYITKWVTVSRVNHFFDAMAYASAAASYCGASPVQASASSGQQPPPPTSEAIDQQYVMPDGRNFYR